MKAGTYRVTVVDGETTREELVFADDFTIAPSFFGGCGSLTLTLNGANVAYFPNCRWKGEVVRVEQPAAKAALDALNEQDALIEQGAEQWVEIDRFVSCTKDGERWKVRHYTGDPYVEVSPDKLRFTVDSYRKGREVAEAEHEALREQVKALVEAVLGGGSITTSVNWVRDWPYSVLVDENWYARIKSLARKVQL